MNPTFFVFCEGKTEAAYVDLLCVAVFACRWKL